MTGAIFRQMLAVSFRLMLTMTPGGMRGMSDFQSNVDSEIQNNVICEVKLDE